MRIRLFPRSHKYPKSLAKKFALRDRLRTKVANDGHYVSGQFNIEHLAAVTSPKWSS